MTTTPTNADSVVADDRLAAALAANEKLADALRIVRADIAGMRAQMQEQERVDLRVQALGAAVHYANSYEKPPQHDYVVTVARVFHAYLAGAEQ